MYLFIYISSPHFQATKPQKFGNTTPQKKKQKTKHEPTPVKPGIPGNLWHPKIAKKWMMPRSWWRCRTQHPSSRPLDSTCLWGIFLGTNGGESLRYFLVGGWTHHFEKYARQDGFIFPKFRGENKKSLKPLPSFGGQKFWVKTSQIPTDV